MPSYRIGFGSDFTLKNQKLGVGTDTASVELDVRGTASFNTADLGVSTFSSYSGFSAQEYTNTDLVLSSDEYSTTGDIVVGVNSTFTVSVGATVTVGTVESVSIGTHFSLPTGDINDRPEVPVEGTVRFNKDLNTLEFYNGVEWRQFTVNGASGRGVLGPSPSPGGGASPTANLGTLSVVNESTNTYWGDLSLGKYSQNTSVSSETRIIFGGGTPYASPWPVTDAMDYKPIASDGNTQDFGNLTDARRALTSFSSSTRGIVVGGVEPASINIIEYVEISTVGNALDFGDCMTAGRHQGSGCSSPTRGFFVHGNPNNRDYIEVLTIASKGNSIKFGNRLFDGGYTSGNCNGVRALFGGGYQSSPIAGINRGEITKITVSSDGDETYFGDLTAARYHSIGLSSKTRAVWVGGSSSGQTIDSVLYESDGKAVNFGELDRARWSTAGSSDCHGGLGGY